MATVGVKGLTLRGVRLVYNTQQYPKLMNPCSVKAVSTELTTNIVAVLIHGCDQRDQPIVFDAVHVTLGCMSEINGWLTLR